jgi:hypothetical protein
MYYSITSILINFTDFSIVKHLKNNKINNALRFGDRIGT